MGSTSSPTKSFFVSIIASVESGLGNVSVTFTLSVVGGTAPLTYLWTFSEGINSTSASPTNTFNNIGTGTATVTVTDSKGNTATATKSVSVLSAGGMILTGYALSEGIAPTESFNNFNDTQHSPNESPTMTESFTKTN